MTTLALVLRLLLAALLAATGLGKLLDPAGFVAVLRTYDALPAVALWPTAVLLIAFELVLALLLAKRRPLGAARACALLHVGFAAWSAVALLRGLRIPNCGCFGVFLVRPLTWARVGEDLAIAAASLLLRAALRRTSSAARPAGFAA